MLFVSVGADFVRVRERFDVLGQTLDTSVPRLGLGFPASFHVHE